MRGPKTERRWLRDRLPVTTQTDNQTSHFSQASSRASMHRSTVTDDVHFRSLFEHSLDAVSLIAADGTVLYTTPATTSILGYEREELVGTNVFAFMHPADLAGAQSLF